MLGLQAACGAHERTTVMGLRLLLQFPAHKPTPYTTPTHTNTGKSTRRASSRCRWPRCLAWLCLAVHVCLSISSSSSCIITPNSAAAVMSSTLLDDGDALAHSLQTMSASLEVHRWSPNVNGAGW